MKPLTFKEVNSVSSRSLLLGVITLSILIFWGTRTETSEVTSTSDSIHSITGIVKYCGTDVPVDSVEMNLTGFDSETVFTDDMGSYLFDSLVEGENYCVSLRKMDSLKNVVTYFDVSLIFRGMLGLYRLDSCDTMAGDVSGDGFVSSFDAIMIRSYVKGYENLFPVGEWRFEPDSICYVDLSTDQYGQNYQALIYGDVSQNWPGFVDTLETPQAVVSITDTIAEPGDFCYLYVTIDPIRLECLDSLKIYSFEAILKFDPTILTVYFVRNENSITENWEMWDYRIEETQGIIHFGMAGYEPLKWCGQGCVSVLCVGVLVNLEASPGDSCLLSFENWMLNEGSPRVVIENVIFKVKEETGTVEGDRVQSLPEEFALSQNYPNPFNIEASIKFQLPVESWIILKIYNILGQEVRTLLDEQKEAEYYSVTWDGKDSQGNVVPSGVYFYQLQAGNYTRTKKMLLLK